MARQDYNTQPVDGSGVLIYLSVQAINPGAAVNFTIRPYAAGSEPTNGSGSMLVGWPDVTAIPFTITNGTVYTQSCTSTDIQLSNNQINENLPIGSAVGTFTTIDPDGSGGFYYELTGAATGNAYFTISGNELRTNAVFNYEAISTYSISVKSWSDTDSPIVRPFTITITDANDPPVLGAIGAKSVNELASLTFTAIAADADTLPAPDTLTYSLANGTSGLVPAGASIVPSSGAFTWTPTEAQGPGSYPFDVCVSDGLASGCETITVTVNEVNQPPTAVDDTFPTVIEDSSNNILDVLANDTDGDLPANPLTVTAVSSASKGTVTIGPAGAHVVYTPNPNANGNDTFTYTLSDGSGGTDTGTVSITVTAVNDTPVANAQLVPSLNEDTATPITLTATDVDNDPLTYSIVTPPSHGTLSGSGATWTYTPAANYNGPDSFTFKVNDGAVDSSPATVSITVNALNDAPVANAQTPSVAEDTATPITLTATDVDNDPLTYSIVTPPSHGTLSSSGAIRTYTPTANYFGPDSFTFRVNDGTTNSSPATVTITVNAVNDAPVGVVDSYIFNGAKDISAPGVLENDSDVDGDTLTASLTTQAVHGTATVNADGSFTYDPTTGYAGTDSFKYNLSDGTATVVVQVNLLIDRTAPPVAQWLSPVTALAGSSSYYGITYDASTATVPLKVFVDGISDVAKVEFRWYDHTQTPGVWQVIGFDDTPTLESGKNVYTASLNMDSLPFTDQIQVWAYTYDAAGNYTRIVKVNGFDYWARILVNHNPTGYNVFLPFIRR